MTLMWIVMVMATITGGIGVAVRRQPAPALEIDQSLARFAMVAIAQVLAFIVFLTPLLWATNYQEDWAEDCRHYGLLTAVVDVLVITGFLSLSRIYISPSIPWWTEFLIVIIYYADVVGLTAAVIRTGGPARSLYASLLPIQFAGFLLLELQKDLLVSRRQAKNIPNYRVWVFASLTLFGWLASYWFQTPVLYLLARSGHRQQTDFSNWIVYLSACGLALTAIAYFLPQQPWFVDMIEGRFRSPRNGKTELPHR